RGHRRNSPVPTAFREWQCVGCWRSHLRPRASDDAGADLFGYGADPGKIGRPVYPADPTYDVGARDVADLAAHTAVGRVVAVVAHHEIMLGRNLVDRRVVVESVWDQIDRCNADAVGQDFALERHLFRFSLELIRARVDGGYGLSIDVQDAIAHLNL